MATRLVGLARKGFAGNRRPRTEAGTMDEVRVLSVLSLFVIDM